MVRALEPGDDTNPDPTPGAALVTGEVRDASLGSAFTALAPHGLNTAQAKAALDSIFGGASIDDVLTALRFGDLVAQAYRAKVVSGTALPAAIADWVTAWQGARTAVEGAAADILLDL